MIVLSIIVALLLIYTICLHIYAGKISQRGYFTEKALKTICEILGFSFRYCSYDREIYIEKYGKFYDASKHPVDRETIDQNTERFVGWIERLRDLEVYLGVHHFVKETPAKKVSGYEKEKGKK